MTLRDAMRRYLDQLNKEEVQRLSVRSWRAEEQSRPEIEPERSWRAEEQRHQEIERERSRRPPVPPPPVTSLPTELGGLLDLPGGESFAKNPGEVAYAQEQARAARDRARMHRDDPGVDTGG